MASEGYIKDDDFIRNNIGVAACYEQLAEEASELAHAALKHARALRDENPTPVGSEESYRQVKEEFNDLLVCTGVLEIPVDTEYMDYKQARWTLRIKEHNDRIDAEDISK